jgi:hypothetical protein
LECSAARDLYFCPVALGLTLKHQVTGPTPGARAGDSTRIATRSISSSEILSALLTQAEISDAEDPAWGLYAYAPSDKYSSEEDFLLVLAHPDGRYHLLDSAWQPDLELLATSLVQAQRDYTASVLLKDDSRSLHHAEFSLGLPHPDPAQSLHLHELTGTLHTASSYGPIAQETLSLVRARRPISSLASLVGRYSTPTGEIGLATLTLEIAPPLATKAIPAGWLSLDPADSWFISIGSSASSSSAMSLDLPAAPRPRPLWW